ncbi:MAG: NAD(P)-dependent alcohol dehydrogenase [Myxococcales bacterium]|nr:NAD(P)-dependent alcohol dehydrogenase [Myxococcales bacterium]
MRAVYRTQYGPPEVLRIEERTPPTPRPGELLVKVRATTVNRTDCGSLWGKPFVFRFFTGLPRPRHTATGTDFAGDVVELGEGVSGFARGDRVFGFDDNVAGTHAEFVCFSTRKGVAKIPDGVPYEQAAASLEGAHYALNFMRKVTLGSGCRVLVNGATGAIGSAAVQLLKLRGAHVTAVCASPHVALVASLGADRVIDRTQEDFTQQDDLYDFVFDAVGKSTFGACKRILVARGVYISSELGPGGQNLAFALLSPLSRGKRVVFPLPLDIPGSVVHMQSLLALGKWKPLIDRVYPLEQIAEAFRYVASGQKIGNVVLKIA